MTIYTVWTTQAGAMVVTGEAKAAKDFYTFPNKQNNWFQTRVPKRAASQSREEAIRVAQAQNAREIARLTDALADAQFIQMQLADLASQEAK